AADAKRQRCRGCLCPRPGIPATGRTGRLTREEESRRPPNRGPPPKEPPAEGPPRGGPRSPEVRQCDVRATLRVRGRVPDCSGLNHAIVSCPAHYGGNFLPVSPRKTA